MDIASSAKDYKIIKCYTAVGDIEWKILGKFLKMRHGSRMGVNGSSGWYKTEQGLTGTH